MTCVTPLRPGLPSKRRTFVHLAARVGGIEIQRRNPGPLAYDEPRDRRQCLRRITTVRDFEARRCVLRRLSEVRRRPLLEATVERLSRRVERPVRAREEDAHRSQRRLPPEYHFDSVAPVIANLYGPGDNYDLRLPCDAAMIRKFVEAAEAEEDEVVYGHRQADARVSVCGGCCTSGFFGGRASGLVGAGQPRDGKETSIRTWRSASRPSPAMRAK